MRVQVNDSDATMDNKDCPACGAGEGCIAAKGRSG